MPGAWVHSILGAAVAGSSYLTYREFLVYRGSKPVPKLSDEIRLRKYPNIGRTIIELGITVYFLGWLVGPLPDILEPATSWHHRSFSTA